MENDYILKMIKSALQGIAYILKGKKSIEENIDLKRCILFLLYLYF